MKLSLPGLFLMLLSVYCEAMRLMLTQRMLQKLHFHVLEGLYFTAPASAIWMLLLAAVVEIPRLKLGPVWLAISQHWLLFVGASLLGFLVNVTSFLVIQRTNVVMLKLLAISRNAMVRTLLCGRPIYRGLTCCKGHSICRRSSSAELSSSRRASRSYRQEATWYRCCSSSFIITCN
mmetsp:Transcript_64944/g.115096  ORF Transcript_64944/g.115096 Transcript_64944/m.115096 type:complete len:176 (+) Transcript_64944:93-620(+)